MKYLVLTNHSYMLWQFRRELLAKLKETGEVVLSMPFVGHEDDFQKEYKCIDTKVDRRGINPITDYQLYSFYRKLIKDEKPDIVITYSIKANVYGGYASRKLKVPYCVNVQGLGTAFEKKMLAPLVTKMYKAAVKRAKTVFFENEFNAQEFIRRGITTREQVTVLNGAGVNLDYYKFSEYPSEENGITFLYLGRIMKEKGIDEFLYSVKKLKNKYNDRVNFDMVGFFEDEYKQTIEDLSKQGYIAFHGFQSNPIPFYQRAHCVVLPSYHEGMSNVLLEAAATGRAIITTDIPGCREAVDDGVSGYLCNKMDADSLLDAMERFISLSMESRVAMGQHGREKIEMSFDKLDVVKKTIKAINK
ncbi:MAG: glycosyltransferase family 4 protein [Clostridia bacterium]|nr:glycosyltransferase family 4 protein [Clostridia bacterium]